MVFLWLEKSKVPGLCPSAYASPNYPDYMCGPSYLMAKNTVKSLLDTLEEYSGPVFYTEDVFITGVLSQKADI